MISLLTQLCIRMMHYLYLVVSDFEQKSGYGPENYRVFIAGTSFSTLPGTHVIYNVLFFGYVFNLYVVVCFRSRFSAKNENDCSSQLSLSFFFFSILPESHVNFDLFPCTASYFKIMYVKQQVQTP